MTSIYDFDKLAKLLNSLYLLTGRKITLKDSDFNNVITSNTACEFCRLIQSTPFATRNAWPAIQRRWPMRNGRTRRLSTDVMPDGWRRRCR